MNPSTGSWRPGTSAVSRGCLYAVVGVCWAATSSWSVLPAVAQEASKKEEAAAKVEPAPSAVPAEESAAPAPPDDRRRADKRKEKQDVHVTRDQYSKTPGAPRSPLENFEAPKPLDAGPPLLKTEVSQFDEMRRGNRDVRPDLIDKVAKHHVYEMTKPDRVNRLTDISTDILGRIRTARTPRGQDNLQFIREYKKALVKYLADLLDNSLVVRINAILLLTRLHDGVADIPDAVPLFNRVLSDPKQEDATYLVAMRGLEAAKRQRVIQVDHERDAANALLTIASNPDTQEILQEVIAETLGTLGRAFRGDLPEQAEVGTFLANLALDTQRPLRLRYEAAAALGRLRVQNIRDWNYDLEALILAKVLVDIVRNVADNKLNLDTAKYWIFNIGVAYKEMTAETSTPALGKLREVIGPIISEMLAAKKPAAEDPPLNPNTQPLEEWIASQEPPKDLKLAPRAVAVQYQDKTEKVGNPNGTTIK